MKKTNEIVKIQEFQIETEDAFHDSQYMNSKKIVSMTIIQIVIVSVIGIWQIYSLRKVFKEKAWI
jgi:hypothetical protein